MQTLELCHKMCLKNGIAHVKSATFVNYTNQVSSLCAIEFTSCFIKLRDEMVRKELFPSELLSVKSVNSVRCGDDFRVHP